ncbi:MAG TPA: cytochrome c3 family protein, partial [Deferrisomatales bacterium]|nr:cytochrome c3 family protein [Deferrisomatales bacterium]
MPKNRVVVSSDKLLVLAKGSGEDRITVQIEAGGSVREGQAKPKAAGIFRFELPLTPGQNVIHVGTERREVFFAQAGATPPKDFLPQILHANTIDKCDACHDAGWKLLKDGYPEVCLGCHVVEAHNPKYTQSFRDDRHFRTSGASCGKCHDPHGERNARLLVGTPETFCGRCHGSWGDTQDRHAAFEEGSCTACHDPHFSGYPNQLHQEVPDLCADCHDEGEHGPEAHREALTACATCHDPHGEAGTKLLRGDVAALCGECHDGMAEGDTVHPALDEGCNACHKPHRDGDRAQAGL